MLNIEELSIEMKSVLFLILSISNIYYLKML